MVAIKLDPAAEIEFYDIIEYYKGFDHSLPHDFIQAFDVTVERLINFPQAGHPYLHHTKRVFLGRFPYAIVYKIYNDKLIMIFTIMHMKRKPNYWNKRLQ